MGKAVVLFFLLDTLPNFDKVINKTSHILLPETQTTSCSPEINEAILEVINEKLGYTDTVEQEFTEIRKTSDSIEDLSSDTLSNTIYDDSVPDADFHDKSLDKTINIDYENLNATTEDEIDISECEKPSINLKINKQNSTKESYPKSAPFLAAIFETVSNVTAQTCGGVLLATHWVLTAASCVNVLGQFYGNTSHQVNSSYTIVIGATNPLKDGTVHNVSEIILHPNVSNSLQESFKKDDIESMKPPTLALLKIDPGLEGEMLEIPEVKMESEVTADMYGWALIQNGTTGSAMLATSIPVEMLSTQQCASLYGAVQAHDTLCLLVNDASPGVTRMTSGGPVVSRGRLLGLALSDGSPLVATALLAHRDWIKKVIGTRT